MASEVEGQQVTFYCDKCDEEFVTSGSFKDAWESAKEDGWRTFKDGDDTWQHRCPDCRGR